MRLRKANKTKYAVLLTDADKQQLLHLIAIQNIRIRIFLRARILLLTSDDMTDRDIREELKVSVIMIKKTRKNYLDGGITKALYTQYKLSTLSLPASVSASV